MVALKANFLAQDSDLIVYSDGPKSLADQDSVNQVREYIKTVRGFNSVTLIDREKNLGLANSIITGVSEQLANHGRVIVVEDDLVTSPYFLQYMNEALDFYANDSRVFSIHGYTYPLKGELPETYFIRGASCWGWATWARAWAFFEKDAQSLYDQLKQKNLIHDFDFRGAYPYSKMLLDHVAGKVNSWAIRWLASAYLQGGLTLYPGRSLVQNIGFDQSGTHCIETDLFKVSLTLSPVVVGRVAVEHSDTVYEKFRDYFLGMKPPFFRRCLNFSKRFFKKYI